MVNPKLPASELCVALLVLREVSSSAAIPLMRSHWHFNLIAVLWLHPWDALVKRDLVLQFCQVSETGRWSWCKTWAPLLLQIQRGAVKVRLKQARGLGWALGGISLTGEGSSAARGSLGRCHSLSQVSQCLRDTWTMPLTCCNFWLALNWSCSWTRWSW